MKKIGTIVALVFLLSILAGCASDPSRYNTQRGAGWGAGLGGIIGALAFQSNSWQGLLIGAAAGAIVGAVVGNTVDQQEQAKRDAAKSNKRVIYYDNNDGAVEAIPLASNQQTNCKKIRTRIWEKGEIISDTIEEVCKGTKNSPTY